MNDPTAPGASARVVFEPGGYARFSGATVPPRQRVQALLRVFAGDQWRTVKSKLFAVAFLLPALAMVAITVVRDKLGIEGIAVPHGEEAEWVAKLIAILGQINAAVLLIGLAGQVAPVIARDAHEGALLLYFSRPLLRPHYLVARLGAAWLSSSLLLAAPGALLVLGCATQYGWSPGGCPIPGAGGGVWWLWLLVGQCVWAAAIGFAASLTALAAGVAVRNPSSAPLAFAGVVLASVAGSWVLQAAWGRETAARAVDLHHAMSGLWTLWIFPLDPSKPPQSALVGAAGGVLAWALLATGAWVLLQRFLADPPLGKGRA